MARVLRSYGESRVRPLWVIAVLAITLLWRAPSFVDPPWVNDEGTYFAVAQAMAHGYRLYAGVWENKPPALYLLYELVYHPLGAALPAVRILATLAVLSLVVLVVALSGRFASPSQAPAAGMLAGLIMGVPFLEGTTANAEVFLVVFTSAAAWLALREQYFVAGLAASLAVLFKAVAGFDAAAILVFLVIRGSLRPGPDAPSALRAKKKYAVGSSAMSQTVLRATLLPKASAAHRCR